MKIGVHFTATKNQGGVYQYSLSFLEALSKIKGHQYLVFTNSLEIPQVFHNNKNFRILYYRQNSQSVGNKIRNLYTYAIFRLLPQVVGRSLYGHFYPLLTLLLKISQQDLLRLINHYKPNLILEPITTGLSLLTDIPTVVAIHDLEHKVRPRFQEVSAKGIWEHREYLYSNVSRRAYKILVDSKIGREDLINSYQPHREKIVIMPFLAPSYLNPRISAQKIEAIGRQLMLPKKFIFYPAKFWPHKNHLNLVKAVGELKKEGLKVNLVLSGSQVADFSSFPQVMDTVKRLKIDNQILFLGYVDNDQLSTLYKLSQAMVMPTFLGPTNIPVLEAWVMGTPVLYSDIRGPREQLGDAGLLINPHRPKDIAKQIARIYRSSKLRQQLIHKGKARVGQWTQKDVVKTIKAIVDDFDTIKAI